MTGDGSGSPVVLLVGAWLYPWYQQACATALESLGCRVVPFSWRQEFYVPDRVPGMHRPRNRWLALQNRLLAGPAIAAVNRRLVEVAGSLRPDVVWFYNSTHIRPSTFRRLRERLPNAVIAQYTNDNPFSRQTRPDYWRHLKQALPLVDVHFAYRHSNVEQFRQITGRPAHLLRSYFVPSENYPEPRPSGDTEYSADAVFVGHHEADGRAASLAALERAGLKVNVFGSGWPAPSIRPALGSDYRKAIGGASVALCFLSKLNADSYTRRNFEIPAMGAFMLSEYSDDLAGMFEEGVEAEFFRTQAELVDKAQFYARHERARQAIAARGRERVLRDGHDVTSRMRTFLQAVGAAR